MISASFGPDLWLGGKCSAPASDLECRPEPTPIILPVRRRILLVEDNPADVFLLKNLLEQASVHYEMMVFRHGDTAMAYALSDAAYAPFTPDLILVDLNLPGRSGQEVIRALKQNPALRRVTVVVVTSSTDPRERAEAVTSGAELFIQKPVGITEMEEFVEAIKAALLR